MTEIVHGTNGRIYWVDEHTCIAELARCQWLVYAGRNEDGDQIVLPCGAQLTKLDDDGWACAAGHEHLTYGTEAQQAQERQEWARERAEAQQGARHDA